MTPASARLVRHAAAFIALTALSGELALAQGNYPARPVRIIVGFAPASSNDILARFMGMKLTERLGQQVVVENRPGASGTIGADIAARANPDGHTLLLITSSYTMSPAIYKLPYDAKKALGPAAMLGDGPLALVATPSFAPKTVRELIAFAKARPNGVSYATAGLGGVNHFGTALFARVAGIELLHVPYKGGAPGLADVMTGQINIMLGSLPLTLPHIRSGKVRPLGTSGRERAAQLPDVPTLAEAGAAGYEMRIWWGLGITAGSPGSAVSLLNREINAVLAEPETLKRMTLLGAAPNPMTVAVFGKHILSEIDRWARVAREAKITLQ